MWAGDYEQIINYDWPKAIYLARNSDLICEEDHHPKPCSKP